MDKKLKVQKNWRKIIILSTILFVVIILQDVSREIFVFQNDVEDLKTVLNDQLNNELMDEVEFRIDEIEAIINDSDLDYETHLIDELDDLGYVVEKTIEFYDGQSEEIILTQIGNSIKGFKDSDHSHKYYLMNMQGKLLYDGLLEQEVSIEQIDFSDDFNRFYIQEIIENLTTNPDTYAHIDSFFLEEDTTQLGYLAIKIKNSNYILYSVGDTREFQEEQLSYITNN